MKKYLLFIIFAISISCAAQDSLNYYNKNIEISFKKNNLNGSDYFFNKKLNYLKTSDDLEEYFYAHFDYFLLHPKNDRISILQNADKYKWREPKTNDEKIAKLHVLVNIAYHLKSFSAISESIIAYEKMLFYFDNQQIKKYDIVEYCLKPLANNYTRLGDYSRAEDVLINTVNILEKAKEKDLLIDTYLNLSILYQSENKTTKAINLLKSILKINKLNKTQQSIYFSEIARNYYENSDYKNATLYLYKSSNLKPSKKIKQRNLILQGLICIEIKQYNIALKPLLTALKITKEVYGKNDREVAKVYVLLAKNFQFLDQPNRTLDNYQLALKTLIPNLDNHNDLINELYAENTFTSIFDGKAILFESQNNYKLAIENLNLANTANNLLQYNYTAQESKIIQQTENRVRTEKIIDLNHKLYKTTNNKKYINTIFKQIESTKAMVLTNETKEKEHYKIFNTDSLFLQKNKLEKEKGFLINKIELETQKSKSVNIKIIQSLIAEKTKLTTKLSILKEQIRSKYPYLISNLKDFDLDKFKSNFLQENQILINFFDTQNQLYILSVAKDKDLTFRIVTKDSTYQKNIKTFINLFANGSGRTIKNNISIYHKSAYYLYEKLLAPELKNNTNKTLTIIPDGKLNFIAFDALLTKKTTNTSFSKLPYLVYKNQINLSYSVTILQEQLTKNKSKTNHKILGFFPVFENNHRNLQELASTINEAKAIKKYYKGTFLEKGKATKERFLNLSENYDILHLSTHANAGNFIASASIAFRNKTLYLPEIYGLNLNTDLLILSACETGIGKLQKGEGAMSLARGFTYAGVQNLLVSLWKVNDKSTSILMGDFYKNYAKSNIKIDALHKAKLDYLNNKDISNFKKSPYYWSSFVFIGNTELITTTNNYWNYVIVSGLLLLSTLIFILKIKKNK